MTGQLRKLAILGIPLALAYSGCSGGPAMAPPVTGADHGQIVVRLSAAPKEGIKPPPPARDYGPSQGKTGGDFTRVDYKHLKDIAVFLKSPLLDGAGPAPRQATVTANNTGFDHQIILLAPGPKTSQLSLVNSRKTALNLFSESQFDRSLFPGATDVVEKEWAPGLYEVYSEEDETLNAQIVVAESSYALMGQSGDSLLFDHLPPGNYEVTAIGHRLPHWTGKVNVAAGARTTVDAELTVNSLTHSK